MIKGSLVRSLIVSAVAMAGLLGFVLAAGLFVAAILFPSVGAEWVDTLRQIVGDDAVAQLETGVYTIQDAVQQFEYQHGVDQPTGASMAPIQLASVPDATEPPPTETPAVDSSATVQKVVGMATPLPSVDQSVVTPSAASDLATPTVEPVLPTPTTEPAWSLQPLIMPAPKNGAGQWVPFLLGPSGKPVGYRTFLQPDPQRPYAMAAIIAFDLKATRLHFVPGKVRAGLDGRGESPGDGSHRAT